MSTAISPALPKPTKEAEERQENPAGDPPSLIGSEIHGAGSESDVERRQDEHFAPADAVAHPAPEEGAGDGTQAGGDENSCRLTIGQLPVF
jgi:hypothetical protein